MYRILIVDDEVMVRMGLKMAVSWKENGFELVGEASNGVQAMEVVEKSLPDIVITDIKMPMMDGLQLIKELTARYPAIKVLVLSNFDDFDFVKEALKNGAVDYFLKITIEPDKIIEVLRNICEKIETERDHQRVTIELQRKLDESQLVVNSRILSSLMKHALDSEKFQRKVKSIGMELFREQGFLLLILVPEYEKLINSRFGDDHELFQKTLYNFIKGIVHERFLGEMVEYGHDGFVVLVTCESNTFIGIDKVLAGQIRDAVKDSLSIDVTVFYNMWFQAIEKFRVLLLKLNDTKLLGFYEKNDDLIDFEAPVFLWDPMNDAYKNMKKDLLIYLKIGDRNKFRTVFEEFIAEEKARRLNPVILRNGLTSLITYAKECFFEHHGKQMTIDDFHILNRIEKSSTFLELIDYYQIIMDEFERMFNTIGGERWRDEVLKAVEFLEKNIDQQVTLEIVSSLVYMNKSYFCRMFKKETGENFQDYVTKVRMGKAAELLLNSDCKVSEIASLVGYKDLFYFHRVFKSFYGIPPGEYREKSSES